MGLLIKRSILLSYKFSSDIKGSLLVCPTCKQNLLQIYNDSFKHDLNKQGRQLERVATLLDGDESLTFSCLLRCTNSLCLEVVACGGYGACNDEYYEDQFGNYHMVGYKDYYYPKYFHPHLCLFNIPELCPNSVKQAIEESFATFFSSITATTNSIRISIEALLREHEIPSEDEKGRFISLHRRIESISVDSKLYPFKDQLLTLKYMGNDGSHNESEVSKEDIVDAYEVLSDILEKIYPEKKDINVALKRLDDKFRRKP